MPTVPLYNSEGETIGEIALSDSIFGAELNPALIHQAVVTEESHQRQGTADTKTRGEIRGGGRKPWRQKGTGRARQGSIRAPHWRHGGVVFGPHPRDFHKALPKKMRRGAMRSALSAKLNDGEMIGLEPIRLEKIGTKQVVRILSNLSVSGRILLIIPEMDAVLLKSCRNLPGLTVRTAPNFSIRDVVVASKIVLTQGAEVKIEEVLGE